MVQICFHCPINQAKPRLVPFSPFLSEMLVVSILPSQRTEFLGYGQSNTRSSTRDKCDLRFPDSVFWSVFDLVSNICHLFVPSISTRPPSGACFFHSTPQAWMQGVCLCPIHPRHRSLARFVCLGHTRRVSSFALQSTCHVTTSSWQTTCMRTSPSSTSSRNGLVIAVVLVLVLVLLLLLLLWTWIDPMDPREQGRRGANWIAMVWKPRPTQWCRDKWTMGHHPRVVKQMMDADKSASAG